MKRDLRSQDHEPLFLAECAGLPYVIIFCFEPNLMSHADTSVRHLQFQYQSLLQLNEKFKTHSRRVEIFYENVPKVFAWISQAFRINSIFSYRESGTAKTWQRDKEVKQWCGHHSIIWTECQRDGIQRGILNRDGWDKLWFSYMSSSLIRNEYSTSQITLTHHPFQLPDKLKLEWGEYPRAFQPAGEDMAIRYLQSFVESRGVNYNRHISKPTESRLSCGRISPYLAWGNLSVRQVVHFITQHPSAGKGKRWVNGFLTRVKWRDHFIQKFEVECEYETRCINTGYESLEHSYNADYIVAWESGRTGFPLIDACMRCLQETGWINFRMRAMLVSFFCHHLFQDWRWGVYHLGRLFLDYEPGIHFPQFQMQAGTTGINTVRMYNPVKQSLDHDPEGIFIKTWVKELEAVPPSQIHSPHLLTKEEQRQYKIQLGVDYPYPIIELESAARRAREAIWGHRKRDDVRMEGKRILATHARKRKTDVKKRDGEQLSFL
jgi:deoxyribodipyrimidine photo-lyase